MPLAKRGGGILNDEQRTLTLRIIRVRLLSRFAGQAVPRNDEKGTLPQAQ